jgi:superfamily II DNA/RNA helicase
VLIATPGRLNDLLEMGIVKLDSVLFLVLDEADRMVRMLKNLNVALDILFVEYY